ncbi:MAG: DUF2130 domain-containing protein [Pseudomonadota bacterium]
MTDLTISCPKCNADIPLTESLAGPLIAAERAAVEAEIRAEAEAQIARHLAAAQAESAEADAERAEELARLKAESERKDEKLKAAREAQTAAIERERLLREKEEELDLTVQRKLDFALAEAKKVQDAKNDALVQERLQKAREEDALKLAEKDSQMETLKAQIEVLKKKSEQGSMQLQGEAQEVLLEERLQAAFVGDTIDEVGKGVRGADCIQTVNTPTGAAGRIIWESKRTQNWASDWPVKLKEDMRREGADIAVLTSTALPKGVIDFALQDGVWITAHRFAVPLASALRETLMAAHTAKMSREGQETKMELVYDYLTGTRFRQRVEAIVEKFEAMRDDLEKERRFFNRQWNKREEQLRGVIDATVGMYGDLEGIAGRAMPEIDGLSVELLDAPDKD